MRDQKIVDSIRDTIADPDEYVPVRGEDVRRRVRKKIDGVTVDVSWKIQTDGEAVF
ncbi:hypothetical protein PQG76_05785 [Corynebacterium falsenii]|uniref:hypothetical protein n=1 Tax=Corynebacterium falsenii TaxID=108486 RepID=UPI00234D2E95|nr:hypothetical protein [Corynebacterium falsenii]MDC7104020.1 hypothetical protein [Corynebacterium falsenii]